MFHVVSQISVSVPCRVTDICQCFMSCLSYLEVLESQSHSDVLAYFAWLGYFLVVLGGFLNMAIIGLIGIKGAYFGKYWMIVWMMSYINII